MNIIGTRDMTPLERRRKAAGLTLAQLGEKVGVTGRQAWNWEHGRATPHPSLYPKLAKVLHMTPMELPELFSPSAVGVPA